MRYRKPSIQEALCEFGFSEGASWDPTVFGRFIEHFGKELPNREATEGVVVEIRQEGGKLPEQEMRREPRMRFLNGERTQVAQVGRNLATANVLPPYPHWRPFRDFAGKVYEAYRKAAEAGPLQRVTLRYLDRIDLPDGQRKTSDWLEVSSPLIAPFLLDVSEGTCFGRVQKQLGTTVEAFSIQAIFLEEAKIFLDTELVSLEPPQEWEELAQLLDKHHDRVVEIFESSISNQMRDLLEPEQQA